MKIVKVTYTTRPEYTSTNSANILIVMNDLKKMAPPGIFYMACLGSDGKTFTHTAFFNSEEDQKILNDLSSFRSFQEQLKSSTPEISPKQELLTLVGSTSSLFMINKK